MNGMSQQYWWGGIFDAVKSQFFFYLSSGSNSSSKSKEYLENTILKMNSQYIVNLNFRAKNDWKKRRLFFRDFFFGAKIQLILVT